jgi:hypothetical protein
VREIVVNFRGAALGTPRAKRSVVARDCLETTMLIRATEDACFVMLPNGLTLELFYDRALAGRSDEHETASDAAPSSGVWLMGETVVCEVRAGQA